MGSLKLINPNLQILIDTAKKGLLGKIPDTDRAKAQAALEIIKPIMREPIMQTLRINEKELNILDKIVADPTTLWSIPQFTLAKLEQLDSSLKDAVNGRMAVHQLNPYFQDKALSDAAKKELKKVE